MEDNKKIPSSNNTANNSSMSNNAKPESNTSFQFPSTSTSGTSGAAKGAATAASDAMSGVGSATTGGTAFIAQKAIDAGISVGQLGDTKKEMKDGTGGLLGKLLIVITVFILILFGTVLSITHFYMPSPTSSYIENQYLEVEGDSGSSSGERSGFFSILFRFVLKFVGYEYSAPKRYDVVYEDALDTDIDIIKKALTSAYEDVAPKEVKSVIEEKEYDYDLTWASWEECQNPFLTESGEWNVNFAEFMMILNESEQFSVNTLVPEDYQKFFDNQQNLQYLYYLEFDEKWRYIETYTGTKEIPYTEYGKPVYDANGNQVMQTVSDEQTITWDVPAGQTTLTTPRGTYSLNEDNTTLWAEVTIFPYDLLDLCDMVDVDLNASFQYAPDATNMEMYTQTDSYSGLMLQSEAGMSYQELLLRGYAKDIDLGPTEKTPLQRHHHNGIEDFDYGVDENGNIPQFKPGDSENLDAANKYLIEWLKSKVGNPYSQANRNDGYHFDCSSLVYYAYKQLGTDLSFGGSSTAAQIAKGLDAKGKTVSVNNLRPGDVVFYSHDVNGRYKNITHVGVYIGDGRMIDARGVKYGVVERSMPTKNIVMCARPLQ